MKELLSVLFFYLAFVYCLALNYQLGALIRFRYSQWLEDSKDEEMPGTALTNTDIRRKNVLYAFTKLCQLAKKTFHRLGTMPV